MSSLPTDLIWPAFGLMVGIALLLFGGRVRRKAEQQHAARLAELDAGAPETYFEERRDLLAYPPFRNDWSWRLLGAVLMVVGLCYIFLRS